MHLIMKPLHINIFNWLIEKNKSIKSNQRNHAKLPEISSLL
jgi:hypothetical protein